MGKGQKVGHDSGAVGRFSGIRERGPDLLVLIGETFDPEDLATNGASTASPSARVSPLVSVCFLLPHFLSPFCSTKWLFTILSRIKLRNKSKLPASYPIRRDYYWSKWTKRIFKLLMVNVLFKQIYKSQGFSSATKFRGQKLGPRQHKLGRNNVESSEWQKLSLVKFDTAED